MPQIRIFIKGWLKVLWYMFDYIYLPTFSAPKNRKTAEITESRILGKCLLILVGLIYFTCQEVIGQKIYEISGALLMSIGFGGLSQSLACYSRYCPPQKEPRRFNRIAIYNDYGKRLMKTGFLASFAIGIPLILLAGILRYYYDIGSLIGLTGFLIFLMGFAQATVGLRYHIPSLINNS